MSDATLAPARPLSATAVPVPGRRSATTPALAPADERPRLRVVAPRVRRRRAGLLVVSMAVVLFGLLLALTTFQAVIARNQMRLDRTRRELAAAQEHQDKLRLYVARQQSPEYVIARATGELGMAAPTEIAYVAPTVEQAQEVGAAAAGAPGLDPATTPAVVPPVDPLQLPG